MGLNVIWCAHDGCECHISGGAMLDSMQRSGVAVGRIHRVMSRPVHSGQCRRASSE